MCHPLCSLSLSLSPHLYYSLPLPNTLSLSLTLCLSLPLLLGLSLKPKLSRLSNCLERPKLAKRESESVNRRLFAAAAQSGGRSVARSLTVSRGDLLPSSGAAEAATASVLFEVRVVRLFWRTRGSHEDARVSLTHSHTRCLCPTGRLRFYNFECANKVFEIM